MPSGLLVRRERHGMFLSRIRLILGDLAYPAKRFTMRGVGSWSNQAELRFRCGCIICMLSESDRALPPNVALLHSPELTVFSP